MIRKKGASRATTRKETVKRKTIAQLWAKASRRIYNLRLLRFIAKCWTQSVHRDTVCNCSEVPDAIPPK
ncbi:hypothetical protein CEXT_595951 [Caerostris extrusa]|uniref:Ribosomal protein L20 n=1 Tax=Caerostris extrusa TaxID=172846 RepID=A0AAV4Y2J1_CAEEX|nr:hypothetical protein CEXT_595951 [Caerostris extrusa]